MQAFTISIFHIGSDGSFIDDMVTENNVTNAVLTEKTDYDYLDSFSFTLHSMPNKNIKEMLEWCRYWLKPNVTLIKVTHATLGDIFYGHVHSFKETLSGNGSVNIICEDCRGLLRNAYTVFDESSSSDEDESDAEGLIGDSAANIIGRLSSMYNSQFPSFKIWIDGTSDDLTNVLIKENLSLDGCSILDAFRTVLNSIGYEWYSYHFAFPETGSPYFAVRIKKRIELTKEHPLQIRTGLNLLELSLSVDSSSITTGIAGYGGYGYDNHRPYYVEFNEKLYSAFGRSVKMETYDSLVINTPEESNAVKGELVAAVHQAVENLVDNPVEFSASVIDLFAIIPSGAATEEVLPYLSPIRRGTICYLNDNITKAHIKVRVSEAQLNISDLSSSSYTFEANPLDLLDVITNSGGIP